MAVLLPRCAGVDIILGCNGLLWVAPIFTKPQDGLTKIVVPKFTLQQLEAATRCVQNKRNEKERMTENCKKYDVGWLTPSGSRFTLRQGLRADLGHPLGFLTIVFACSYINAVCVLAKLHQLT